MELVVECFAHNAHQYAFVHNGHCQPPLSVRRADRLTMLLNAGGESDVFGEERWALLAGHADNGFHHSVYPPECNDRDWAQ